MTVWDFMNIIKKKTTIVCCPVNMGEDMGEKWGWVGFTGGTIPKTEKSKQNRHLPVSFFHENEARELEAAVGRRVGVNSITNTPSYQNMKYTQI